VSFSSLLLHRDLYLSKLMYTSLLSFIFQGLFSWVFPPSKPARELSELATSAASASSPLDTPTSLSSFLGKLGTPALNLRELSLLEVSLLIFVCSPVASVCFSELIHSSPPVSLLPFFLSHHLLPPSRPFPTQCLTPSVNVSPSSPPSCSLPSKALASLKERPSTSRSRLSASSSLSACMSSTRPRTIEGISERVEGEYLSSQPSLVRASFFPRQLFLSISRPAPGTPIDVVNEYDLAVGFRYTP